jgi:hypothetical protein
MSSKRETSGNLLHFSEDDSGSEAASRWSHFRLRSFPTLKTTPAIGIYLAAAYLRVEDRHFGPTDPPEPESSFRVSVAMRPMRLEAFWDQERWVSHLDHGHHSICLVDMERKPTVKFIDPFELVQFYVPQTALRQFAREHSMPAVEGLRIPPPGSFDPVIASLAFRVHLRASPVLLHRNGAGRLVNEMCYKGWHIHMARSGKRTRVLRRSLQ